MWTHFWDMRSGGRQKLDWDHIYIELPEKEACEAFERLLHRDPLNTTCECCGEDYAISSDESLEELSEYQREYWQTKTKVPLADYIASKDVKVITSAQLAVS